MENTSWSISKCFSNGFWIGFISMFIFWGIWAFCAPVPEMNSLKIGFGYSFLLPFSMSRAWDLLFVIPVAIITAIITKHHSFITEKKDVLIFAIILALSAACGYFGLLFPVAIISLFLFYFGIKSFLEDCSDSYKINYIDMFKESVLFGMTMTVLNLLLAIQYGFAVMLALFIFWILIFCTMTLLIFLLAFPLRKLKSLFSYIRNLLSFNL